MYNERAIIIFRRRNPHSVVTVILLVALVIYLTCAIFSIGYLHPDEHYQIIELAKWKLQDTTPQAIAWEHAATIRPTLQPVLVMEIIRLCRWMGMDNPFHLALILRIITAVIVLFSICQFVKAAGRRITPQYRNALMAATLFFWIVPMIGVHFSSEILSMACLLLLLAGLLKKEQPSLSEAIWMGIIAALGFEFRYQMTFAYIGILLWILVIGKYRWQVWCIATLGFLGVIALCTRLDCWFYGKMVFVPYNYFYMNIVRHVAASFGESPWYIYFLQLAFIPTFGIGLPIVLSVCIGTFRHYRNPVIWAFWAFLLIHCAISHKEPRFLFPLIPLLPLFVVWTYEAILLKLNYRFKIALIGLIVLVNFCGLAHVIFKPATYGKASMMQYLCERARGQDSLKVKTSRGSNPFHTGQLIVQFYLWQPMDVEECDSISNEEKRGIDVIVLQNKDSIDRKRLLAEGYREVYRSMPEWQNFLNRFYHTYNPDRVLIAYEKK